ncbi:prepilin-type N-terminal cleavage/methylation domain-containing protein [Helicovermis profundi]|uniref:Prepilin-type N-terminal cleavage/methylation domain-containing protein n=1 Tax=Helicovermis profundi TaxID=3065157 RepID=A0AAU9ENT9_9FIRM|nr:hypothetical protein HLPR_13170 [Clostridia bacterium S502]
MKNKKGYSLLELIIAMGLLALLVGPFLSVFIDSLNVNKMSDNTVKADYLAQKYMEDFKESSLPSNPITHYTEDKYDISVTYEHKNSDLKDENTTTINTFDNSILETANDSFNYFDDNGILRINNNILTPIASGTVDNNTYVLTLNDSNASNISEIFTYNSNASIVNVNAGEYTITNNKFVLEFDPNESFDSLNLPTKINLHIVNNSKFNIFVYSYDDNYSLMDFTFENNSPSTDINFVDSLTKTPVVNTNNDNFYQVIIEVSKNNFVYSRLISGVKK